jgi:5'-methylthioadenosine phosphorylase
LYEMEAGKVIGEADVPTPFGMPSDPIAVIDFDGVHTAFLPRHGRGHRLLPTEVPSRANIWALKSLGVRQILSISAVGSLREDYHPGQFVVCDQLIDRTRSRPNSYFGEGVVGHVAFGRPFCDGLRRVLVEVLAEHPAADGFHDSGTLVCMEGPLFSTRAESELYRSHGAHCIGMTALPEAKLAREAELCYATVAMVTDFDCWHPDHEAVTVQDIIRVLTANAEKAARLVARLAKDFPREHEPCPIGSDRALDTAIITAPEARDPALLKKLDAVAGRVLKG